MFEVVQTISLSPIVMFVSLLLGVIGIALAVIFYIKGKRERLPCYAVRSFNILDESATSLPKLQVTYEGVSVKQLTATKLAFWNAGSETIDRNHIAEADPLRLALSDENEFLFARVISQSIPANRVAATIDDENRKTVYLSFDFIDKGQGAVFMLLHTDPSGDVELRGTIKGVKEIVSLLTKPRTWFWFMFGLFVGVAFGSISGVVAVFYGYRYAIPIALPSFILAYFLANWVHRRSVEKIIPSSLKAFADPFSKSEID